MMKAVGYNTPGSIERADSLMDIELDKPTAAGFDLLVQVKAISVNPADCKVRQNLPPADDTPKVLGWDAVGEVVEAGDKVTHYEVGDRVWYAGAINRQGTNSEYHLVDERIVGRAPKNLSDTEAAALPLTSLTAWEMLFDRLKVTDPVPGAASAVLVIGGAGGVGSIAIQLLRALTDLTVIATASRAETQKWVKELGAHHIVNHHEPLSKQIESLGIGAPGFVFSTNQTEKYIGQIAEFIAPQGRFGLIDDPAVVDIKPLKPKSISTHWELMFTRPLFQTTDIARQAEILNQVSSLVESGKIQTTVTETLGSLSADTLKKAHKILETGSSRGKVVLAGY